MIGLLVIAVVGVVGFVPLERRAGRHALIPPAIIANRDFAASCVAILCMSATFFASLLYLPQFMESQLGFSPLESGLGMVPALATFALVSFVAGPLYSRVGAKRLATFGAACMCAAAILFSLVGADSGYGALVPGMIVLGIGIGSFYSTATTAGVTSVDESQASLAGGIVYMFQIAGGSIGLGLTTTIFSSFNPPFIDGFQAGFRLDAGIALVGVVISLLFVGGALVRKRAAAPGLTLFDDVLAGAAEQGVVPGAALEDVVAGAADQRVVAGAADQHVVAAAAVQFVVARAADQLVGRGAADQDVVAFAAADRRRDRNQRGRSRPSRCRPRC